MSFPWPVDELILNNALDIAMRYFDLPQGRGAACQRRILRREAIMADWRRGVRDEAVLANKATAEVEMNHPLGERLQAS